MFESNSIVINELIAFIVDPDSGLQAYAKCINHGTRKVDNTDIQEISEVIKVRLTGSELKLLFAGRIITAFEEAN